MQTEIQGLTDAFISSLNEHLWVPSTGERIANSDSEDDLGIAFPHLVTFLQLQQLL